MKSFVNRKFVANTIKGLLDKMGYQVIRKDLDEIAPFEDMQRFVSGELPLMVFDVGANVGQTVDRILRHYPQAAVHAFEPSPACHELLRKHCATLPQVTTWNLGVGAEDSRLLLNENHYSFMSSFLEPGELCAGDTKAVTDVQVVSLDSFCSEHSIPRIDILKIDTQGFELEVFRGAQGLMNELRIGLIFFELTISGLYENLPPYYELLHFLDDRGYKPASFYSPHIQRDLVRWTNMLYVNPLALPQDHEP